MFGIAKFLNATEAEANFVVCIILVHPISLLFKRFVKGETEKHIFSIVFALVFGSLIFGWELAFIIIPVTLSYFMIKHLPRGTAHIVVMVFNIAWVACG